MSVPAIRVRGLGKKYRLGASVSGYRTLRESLASRLSRRRPEQRAETIWAL